MYNLNLKIKLPHFDFNNFFFKCVVLVLLSAHKLYQPYETGNGSRLSQKLSCAILLLFLN